MNYSAIYDCDVANGLGWRVSLFVSGCSLRCKGCFNSIARDFEFGRKFTKETEDKIIKLLKRPYIKGLSLLGGNPTEPENEKVLVPFLRRVRKECPDRDVWMWTGHVMEDLVAKNDQLVPLCDVVIDGPFVEELKDPLLPWCGSSNQRVVNVRKFLEEKVERTSRELEMLLAN